MYLKKLELQGFKSFPDYTCIDFDRGLTAVVGPNGSGKSNISDAVRWVLGEQSVKQLRGGKMEDVIFNGTSARRSMNYAEVSITFDNSDGHIDYAFPEICVTRRLYRSGESEYQINKVNCRLKDITVLFLDTGLGRDGYSLVGQGRVDDILSTKSEDRRRVIEEASGIVKYRVRKDEAQRKLNSTQDNLVRINDILGELEQRKGPLEEQAGKARKFNENYEELKKLETSLLVHKITEANNEMGDSAGLKEQLEKEIREREDEYLKLRKSHQEIIESSEALEIEIEEKRQELSDLTEFEHETQTDKKVAIERLNQTNQRIEELKSDMESTDETVEKLTVELNEKKAKADSLLQAANEAKLLSEELDKERLSKYEEYEAGRKEAGKADSKIKAKTEELFETRKKLTECQAGISALAENMVVCSSTYDVTSLCHALRNEKVYILGGGNNILFDGDFAGYIIKPEIKGIETTAEDDETVILPISTMRLMFGANDAALDMIVFATDGKAPIAPLTERIRQTLYSAHHISPTDKGAMWVMSMQDILNKTNALFGGLTILIWLVGIGTLLAGAVGVSNIMLVTVRERRQEIGIRRALGASPRIIIRQILCESFVLTSLAGIVGIVIGVWLLRLVANIITASSDSGFVLNPQISFGLTMVAFVILIILGIAAGLLPAQKAISVKAVEALQEE